MLEWEIRLCWSGVSYGPSPSSYRDTHVLRHVLGLVPRATSYGARTSCTKHSIQRALHSLYGYRDTRLLRFVLWLAQGWPLGPPPKKVHALRVRSILSNGAHSRSGRGVCACVCVGCGACRVCLVLGIASPSS